VLHMGPGGGDCSQSRRTRQGSIGEGGRSKRRVTRNVLKPNLPSFVWPGTQGWPKKNVPVCDSGVLAGMRSRHYSSLSTFGGGRKNLRFWGTLAKRGCSIKSSCRRGCGPGHRLRSGVGIGPTERNKRPRGGKRGGTCRDEARRRRRCVFRGKLYRGSPRGQFGPREAEVGQGVFHLSKGCLMVRA